MRKNRNQLRFAFMEHDKKACRAEHEKQEERRRRTNEFFNKKRLIEAGLDSKSLYPTARPWWDDL